jgi:hypothetical protein
MSVCPSAPLFETPWLVPDGFSWKFMLGILTRILPHIGFLLNPDNNKRHFKWRSTCYFFVTDWSWNRDGLRSTRGTSWDGRKVWRSEYSNWAWPILNLSVYKYEKCSTGREVGETVDDSNLTFYNIFWLPILPSILWLSWNLAFQGSQYPYGYCCYLCYQGYDGRWVGGRVNRRITL